MLSCSIWFSAQCFWMDGGLESRCVGRVYGADGAVRLYFMRKMHGQSTLKFYFSALNFQDHRFLKGHVIRIVRLVVLCFINSKYLRVKLKLTYSMMQSPSCAANWFEASQEIPRISRNPKVHYRTHKRPPPVSILGQPSPVHIPTSHLLEIHPNIHPSTPWSLSLRFPQQGPIHPPLHNHTRHMLIYIYIYLFIYIFIYTTETKSERQ